MSLDVYLTTKETTKKSGTGVFIRRDGHTVELNPDEIKEKWPDYVPEEQEYETNKVYSRNITHNLNKMAEEAGIYYALWRPDEKGWTHARDIITDLETGLADLKARPDHFKALNPDNGWGSYDGLVDFVEEYLAACKENPDAEIEVSR